MLRRFLVRKFLTATSGGSALVAQDPGAAADCAMSVVGPVLEGMAGEIARLRALHDGSEEEGRS